MDEFKAEVRLDALLSLFKYAPKETARATARFLNDEAFSHREIASKVIRETHTIRSPQFLRLAFWVDKANGNQSPSVQKSISGSVKMDRFSGWAEEVTGQPSERSRLLGTGARSGDMSKIAAQRNRLLPGLKFEEPANFDEIPERQRIPAMLSMLARNPDYTAEGKGMFKIYGGNWTPGVFRFKAGQQAVYRNYKRKGSTLVDKRKGQARDYPAVTRVQTLGESPRPKKTNWPVVSINRLRAWFDPVDVWAKYFKEIVRKYSR